MTKHIIHFIRKINEQKMIQTKKVIVALSAALAGQVLNLDWRPLIRDSVFYAMSICVLITFAWDGIIFWYEEWEKI